MALISFTFFFLFFLSIYRLARCFFSRHAAYAGRAQWIIKYCNISDEGLILACHDEFHNYTNKTSKHFVWYNATVI